MSLIEIVALTGCCVTILLTCVSVGMSLADSVAGNRIYNNRVMGSAGMIMVLTVATVDVLSWIKFVWPHI